MIDDINDILYSSKKDKDEFHIILKDNDLDTAMYQLKQVGSESHFKNNAGKVAEFLMSLKYLNGQEAKNSKKLRTSLAHNTWIYVYV